MITDAGLNTENIIQQIETRLALLTIKPAVNA
jgi:hypothetical protein